MSASEKSWSEAGSKYVEHIKSQQDGATTVRVREACLYPGLLARLSTKAATHILDAGCGEGWLQRWVYQNWPSSKYHGIDISAALLAEAKSNNPSGADDFILSSMEAGFPFSNNAFDLIMSNLVAQWISNLDGMMAEFYRICSSKSRVILTIQHPYFGGKIARWNLSDPDDPILTLASLGPKQLDTYFEAHSNSPIGPLLYFNRTLSEYFQAFVSNKFNVIGMDELTCNESIVKYDRSWIRHVRTPAFVLFELEKA